MLLEPGIARSSLLVTGLTASTVVVSFLSQVVIAWLFGVSAEVDAYWTAFALPSLVTGGLTAGIGYALIPLLAKHKGNVSELRRVRATCFQTVAAAAIGIILVGELCSTPIVKLMAPGLSPEKLQLAARLQVFFWLAVGLSSVAAFSTAVHHFERRFVRPALCLLLVPTSIVVAAALLASQLGVASLALGYLIGTILHCLILLPGSVDRLDFHPSVRPHPGREFAAQLFPVLLTLLPFTALPVIDAFWSSHLPDGSLSYLGYATRIVIGLTSVTIHGVAVVLFPHFSEYAVAGQRERLRALVISSLKFVFLLMVALATIVMSLRVPILTLLFERGSFDRQATLGLGTLLPWYLAGMVGMAAMNIVSRAFYAVSQARTLVLIGLGSLALYAGLSGLLSRSFSYVGIGVSYALYWTVQLIIASAALGLVVEKLWCADQLKFLLKLATASLLVGALLHRASVLLPEAMGPLAKVLLLGSAGIAAFLLTAWLSFTAAEKVDFRSCFAAREAVPSDDACFTNPLVARSDTR